MGLFGLRCFCAGVAIAIVVGLVGPVQAQIVPPECRCGDADDNGTVARGDVLQIRQVLAGLIADVTAPDKCEVLPGAGCGLRNVTALRRVLGRRDPGLTLSCPAGLDPSCPLPDEPVDVVCPAAPLPPAPSGVCSVDVVGTAGVRLRGTILAPGGILEAGEVLVDASGEITCTDCDCSTAPGAAEATVVTCGEGVISPGLINPLAKLSSVEASALVTPVTDYDHRHEWREGAGGKPPLPPTGSASTISRRAAELRHLIAGTTAMSRGTTDGLTRDLDRINALELPPLAFDTFPLGDADGTQLESGCNYPAPVNPNSLADDLVYSFDVAAGIGASARNEFVCLSQDPNDVFSLPLTRPSPVGLIGIDGSAYSVMRSARSVPSISVRSDGFLYGNTASLPALLAGGVPIALATDWPFTGSVSLLRELACADAINQDNFAGALSDRDLWLAVTANAALATGSQLRIGTLQPGRVGDIAVFDARTRSDYRAVIEAGAQEVVLVLRGGEALYGDDALVQALGDPACEAWSVCGIARRACVASEFTDGTVLGDLQAAEAAIGPLFECFGVSEPQCGLTRAEYPGVPSPGDADGDGVLDGEDLCPDLFDPIRPMDGAAQSDLDGDGQGDACDPCPVDAIDDCDLIFVGDLDHDGELNETDNCPVISNPDQFDLDGDGLGELCDNFCNPAFEECATPLSEIRNPSDPDFPGFGSVVSFGDAYVTAVLPDGSLYVQTDELLPWTGILVFRPSPSAAVPGNRITVMGELTDFFGLVEITNGIVTIDDGGTTLPFGPLAIADSASIATGGAQAAELQSMLLQISSVSITNANPDAPGDEDRFVVDGGLLIDDRIDPALDNLAPIGTTFTTLTGVLDLLQNESQLLPRNGSDLDSTDPREVVLLTPSTATVATSDSLEMRVTLTLPAGPGGVFVNIGVVPGISGSAPTTLTVPAGQQSGTFIFTTNALEGVEQVTVSLGASSQQASLTVLTPIVGDSLVINEVDYDQPGSDNAEFIEIFNPTLSTVDLTGLTLSLINGAGSVEYAQFDLTSVGSLLPGAYLVIGDAAVLANVPAGTATLDLGGSIQNGSPDGMQLLDPTTAVIDALSYEGVMIGVTEGSPPVAEDSNVVDGSLNRIPNANDTDDNSADWQFRATPTPGSANQP